MTATQTSYSVISLDEAGSEAAARGFGIQTGPDPDGGRRGRVYVRRDFDIASFGVNAFYQANSGASVIGEHDELGPGASGHEELYVVVSGSCTFIVDGDEVSAPRGTALFVGDPASKRGARADEDGTIVLAIGGRRGEAFKISPGEAMGEFYPLYRGGDYAGALAACREGLKSYPGNALILYNIACLESLLGNTEEAIGPLRESLAAWPAFKELATTDDDLVSLHDDARYQELIAP